MTEALLADQDEPPTTHTEVQDNDNSATTQTENSDDNFTLLTKFFGTTIENGMNMDEHLNSTCLRDLRNTSMA